MHIQNNDITINTAKSLNKQTTEHLDSKNNDSDKSEDKANNVIKSAVFWDVTSGEWWPTSMFWRNLLLSSSV
jgi:hypothetical protein